MRTRLAVRSWPALAMLFILGCGPTSEVTRTMDPPSPTDADVSALERELGATLPREFVELLRSYPGDLGLDERRMLAPDLAGVREATTELRRLARDVHQLSMTGESSVAADCIGIGLAEGDVRFYRPGEGDRVFELSYYDGSVMEVAPSLEAYVRSLRVGRLQLEYWQRHFGSVDSELPEVLHGRGLHPYTRSDAQELVIIDSYDAFERVLRLDAQGQPINREEAERAAIQYVREHTVPLARPLRIYHAVIDDTEWILDFEGLVFGSDEVAFRIEFETGNWRLAELPTFTPYRAARPDRSEMKSEPFQVLEESNGGMRMRWAGRDHRFTRLP